VLGGKRRQERICLDLRESTSNVTGLEADLLPDPNDLPDLEIRDVIALIELELCSPSNDAF
jgi:hypothetical protein